MFFVGFLVELIEPEAVSARWQAALFLITLGCLPLLAAAALLKKSVLSVRHRCCPACASEKRAPAGLLVKGTSWWAWQCGGWLLASLWGASREKQVRCLQCDTLYHTATRGTRIAGALLWMVVLWFLVATLLDSLQTP